MQTCDSLLQWCEPKLQKIDNKLKNDNQHTNTMKKILLVCAAMLAFIIIAPAQSKNVTDSLYKAFQRDFGTAEQTPDAANTMVQATRVPRYKMYSTQNINILLKLDTKRGRIWMVQYRMKDQSAMELSIDNFSAVSENAGWNGRFEMYPTNNMYNFLMIDTETGQVYQVQWSIDYSKRFVEKIY